jgi:ubiquinone/menaquinone biosynthesis C-methylase UbiE
VLGLLLYPFFGLNNYNSIAFLYDFAAKFIYGDNLYKIQIDALSQLPAEGKLLILGGGTGQILKWLHKNRPKIQIAFQDASSKMIEIAKRRVHESQNIQFIHSASFNHDYQCDFVFAAFFFDLFTLNQSQNIIASVQNSNKDNLTWHVCDFVIDDKTKAKLLRKVQVKLSILFFKLTANHQLNYLPQVFQSFTGKGFKCMHNSTLGGGFLCSQAFKAQ